MNALVGCAVLRAELAALAGSLPALEAHFLPSHLHLEPASLDRELGTALDACAGRAVVLAYGDCCPAMRRLAARPGVVRTPGLSCCELLLGQAEYRRLLRAGAFFLLPEWTPRWRTVFTCDLELEAEAARALMGELHTRLVYLDTGVVPVPAAELAACAAFCGLPLEVLPVPLDHLRAILADALQRLQEQEGGL
jgi:hypothetical protein